ncbi:N-terminal phage integrase SAM-like domain-containing protein [Frankia tisae]|uniref:N-terminal phage integrase SAM-like domain-containing protein n=1 Tax=Frankia tisae TaxID=2950104 RepID=UPI0021BFD341|nr:N-terminal phage integrase SAM-like domain-containing protein [Frankia tisae]
MGGLTVSAYLLDWHGRKDRLRPTTRNCYERFIRLHLVPTLGEMPLVALRAEHIDAALKRAAVNAADRERPIGPATIADVYQMLKTALGDALKQRTIEFNLAIGVELPEYSAPEVEPWEAEEVGAFLARLFILAHRLRQDEERATAGPGWDKGTLPDEHGKPVRLKDLMFTHPSGRHRDPQYVTRRMQRIAWRAGLCAAIREPAAAGDVEVVVGERVPGSRSGRGRATWTVSRLARSPSPRSPGCAGSGPDCTSTDRYRLMSASAVSWADRCCRAGGCMTFATRRRRSS